MNILLYLGHVRTVFGSSNNLSNSPDMLERALIERKICKGKYLFLNKSRPTESKKYIGLLAPNICRTIYYLLIRQIDEDTSYVLVSSAETWMWGCAKNKCPTRALHGIRGESRFFCVFLIHFRSIRPPPERDVWRSFKLRYLVKNSMSCPGYTTTIIMIKNKKMFNFRQFCVTKHGHHTEIISPDKN